VTGKIAVEKAAGVPPASSANTLGATKKRKRLGRALNHGVDTTRMQKNGRVL